MSNLHPFRYSAATHTGKVRKVNEDSILTLPDHGVFVVSDGMGGHDAGDYASQTIVDSIAMIPPGLEPGEMLRAVRDAIQRAHAAICAEATSRGGGSRFRMRGSRGRITVPWNSEGSQPFDQFKTPSTGKPRGSVIAT